LQALLAATETSTHSCTSSFYRTELKELHTCSFLQKKRVYIHMLLKYYHIIDVLLLGGIIIIHTEMSMNEINIYTKGKKE